MSGVLQLLKFAVAVVAGAAPSLALAEPSGADGGFAPGCYHATIDEEDLSNPFAGALSGIDLSLESDGRYVLGLALGQDVSLHRGRWHRDRSRIVFDTIASDPLIAFESASGWTDEMARHARSAARLIAPDSKETARALEQGPALAITVRALGVPEPVRHADFDMLVRFADGRTEPAFWDGGSIWAIAQDLGTVRSIEIDGPETARDPSIVVPIPPEAADERVFSLRLDTFALLIGDEPMPPLTIDGNELVFAGDVRFVGGEFCQ